MLTLKRTNSDNTDFQQLVLMLNKDLEKRNGVVNDFFVQFNKIDEIKNVIIIYENHQAVGCGAMKKYDDNTMEIKRMYVPLGNRGKGIATKVLQELEIWAKELGYKKCILETGNKMSEAISLYEKNSFKIISNYGQYVNITDSICFEKTIEY
ncbi:MAG: GNAT family N-acetyltransferase [Bacteroidetes bacterium]|nr:GNAT family N-acetyltransferase [Bacteroidota bacterium]